MSYLLTAATLTATVLSIAGCANATTSATTSAATRPAHAASSPPVSPGVVACRQFNAVAPRLNALLATATRDPLAVAITSGNEKPSQMPKDTRALIRITNAVVKASGALDRGFNNLSLANDFEDAVAALLTVPTEAGISATLPGPSHAAIQRARHKVARVATDCG